jgi:putative membrane protein
MTKHHRAPQAFVIDKKSSVKKPAISFDVEHPSPDIVVAPHMPVHRRGPRWGNILLAALLSLFTLWAGFTITQMIYAFFASSPLLGWTALGIAAIIGIASLALIIREIWGLSRLRRIEKLQLTAAHALNQDDEASAQLTISGLLDLYHNQPHHAWNLKNYAIHAADILDPRDRVRLAERYLVNPLDETAHRIIARRSRRVTLLTTITPAAALDILFVAVQNIAMLRELATLYGGKPSTFATFRLARMVVSHLAIAGGLALSDNFIHLFVGKGLLGKLSTRFGEGAVNGILTSRVGLAACDVCRPIPQESGKREKLVNLIKELANFGSKAENVP